MESTVHIPVLRNEVLAVFQDNLSGEKLKFFDGTLGGAGHTVGLLELFSDSFVVAFDQDLKAIERASHKLNSFAPRVELHHANFRSVSQLLPRKKFDGLLLDLGISSDQLDNPERGFSFKAKEKLDMRMNQNQGATALELLNTLSLKELARVFSQGGVRNLSLKLAQEILEQRPIADAEQFISICSSVLDSPRQRRLRGGKEKHPATVPYQALRIEVNDEFGAIKEFLDSAQLLASPGAVLAVITFHSLEDELVTKKFRSWDKVGSPSRYLPEGKKIGEHLTQKPVEPSQEEILRNPRSRSARLRAFKFEDSQKV